MKTPRALKAETILKITFTLIFIYSFYVLISTAISNPEYFNF